MSAAITIESLRKVWPDGTVALDGVSLTVPPGEIVAILGRSGAGKSTLLRCASRLIEPSSGKVTVGGVEITAARGRALARSRAAIGFVFQQFNLVRSYTVLENVLVARISHVSYARGLIGLFTPADRAIALACLDKVGLADKAGALARELSGGQQQRVAIARAFAQEPRALFADEPTASLDPRLSETVLEMLRAYGRTQQVPVLINVHTLEHARAFADRVIGMRRGAIVHDGPVAGLDERTVEAIYGGDDEVAA
jgi:phosphonate transport system ATP-binding protein